MNKYEFWTDEVEEAVSKYASCIDVDERNKIYMKYLHNAFIKLINYVLERYKKDFACEELKNDLLSTLVIHIQKFNPELALSRGYKANVRVYCEVIIRSAISDYLLKSFREKQNVSFNESHEVFLKNIK